MQQLGYIGKWEIGNTEWVINAKLENGNFEWVIYAKFDKWKLEWVINAKLENWKVECVITAMLEKRNSDCEIATFRVLEFRGNTLYDMFEAINIRKTKKCSIIGRKL